MNPKVGDAGLLLLLEANNYTKLCRMEEYQKWMKIWGEGAIHLEIV